MGMTRKSLGEKRSVLILMATYGEGHLRAAQSLEAAIHRLEPDRPVHIVDFFERVSPVTNRVARRLYVGSVRRMPRLYGHWYELTRTIPEDSFVQRAMDHYHLYELWRLLADTNPGVVVSTFPVPAGVLSALRAEQGLSVPSVVAVTDYTVHSQWMHSGVDLYLVAHEELQKAMTDRGVAPERIAVTGIPIDPRFADAARQRLRPDGPPWRILVMGGAYGMLPNTLDLVEGLLELPSVEVALVAGRDNQLRQRGEALRERPGVGERLTVLGYTREIPALMGGCHLLVTKAGGLTISEALAMELPLRIYRPLPGQELSNVDFLVRHGAARVFKNVQTLVEEVRTLVEEAQGRLCDPPPPGLARPDSALAGAARILALAEASSQTAHVSHPPQEHARRPWKRGRKVRAARGTGLHVKRREVLR